MEMLADAATLAIFESGFRERMNWLMQYSIDPGKTFGAVIIEIKSHVKEHVDADASDLWQYAQGQFTTPEGTEAGAGRGTSDPWKSILREALNDS